ncbi:peptidoglycan editing factor PgeF [Pseudoalteromonas sp. JBTF-M23]|uniref:Purine nucleoside phosphorylase n=1 Tax=Pseudoalteromonas caenipelagi TaxID=2726988 RepID=A0A849VC74_9GAMM|nr:peptidoglycan editing factor PgeF [Pseudoalteromonas caenipelagi]NOU50645.1 peptidoglycan editing factor PgeF [Pseudoalteromonas caenipelagi]
MLLPDWPIQNRVGALSTTRVGGQSCVPFESFNLGYHVNDKPNDVNANHKQLLEYLPNPAHWLTQVHGADVLVVDKNTPATFWPKADALYTRLRQQPLAIMTADCLPILVCDQQGREVAAIHGGWKPLVKGIIANTLALFQANPKQLYVWFGPAIGPQKFVVGSDVKAQFCELNRTHEDDFVAQSDGKFMANIYAIAKRQLAQLGVTEVFGGDYCTVTQNELFFSYRRDGKTGRMASLIWRN